MGIIDFEQQVTVASRSVSCAGGIGSSGHPNVYLNIDEKNHVICPYCNRKFIFNMGVADGADH